MQHINEKAPLGKAQLGIYVNFLKVNVPVAFKAPHIRRPIQGPDNTRRDMTDHWGGSPQLSHPPVPVLAPQGKVTPPLSLCPHPPGVMEVMGINKLDNGEFYN